MSGMYSAHEDFVQEIAARPDDDAPRLVYADWLEEQGDPQGEFIRLQLDLAKLSDEPERKKELLRRQRELLRAHRAEWVNAVSSGIRFSEFARGMLEEVVIDGSAFVHDGGQALRRAPILAVGTCLSSKEQIAAFAAMPELRQLRKLRLGCSALGDDGIRRLAESPHFPPLKVLWLSQCNIGFAGLQALGNCTALAGLERLVLTDNPYADVYVRVLAHLPMFGSLRQQQGDRQLVLSRSTESTPRRAPIVPEEPRRNQEAPRRPGRMSVEEILRAARAYRPPTPE